MVYEMKLSEVEAKLEVKGNITDLHTMQIKKDDAKLYSMMIDGLYSNKHGSVVRELSTNALDVHRVCGKKDVPFEIHLPTILNQKFKIRDYGHGLHKDDIIQLFGMLFSTTKDSSNEQTGAYGIGCKSPFAIVNKFIVTSIKDGIKTTVMFVREGKQVPKFFVLSEVETTEPSGVEVSFDSPIEDQERWINEINRQLFMYKTKPNVFIGTELVDIQYPSVTVAGKLKYINRHIYSNIGYFVEMGEVVYPFSIDDNFSELTDCPTKTYIISVNIGDIDVPPDRERVELSTKTINSLKKHVAIIKESLIEHYTKLYNDNYIDTYQYHTKFMYDHRGVINDFIEEQYDSFQCRNEVLLNYKSSLLYDNELFSRKLKSDIDEITVRVYERSEAVDRFSISSLINIFSLDLDIVIANGTSRVHVHKAMKDRGARKYIVISTQVKYIDIVYDLLNTFKGYFSFKKGIYIEKLPSTKKKRDGNNNILAVGDIRGYYKDGYKTPIDRDTLEAILENKDDYVLVEYDQFRDIYRDIVRSGIIDQKKKIVYASSGVYNTNRYSFNRVTEGGMSINMIPHNIDFKRFINSCLDYSIDHTVKRFIYSRYSSKLDSFISQYAKEHLDLFIKEFDGNLVQVSDKVFLGSVYKTKPYIEMLKVLNVNINQYPELYDILLKSYISNINSNL